MLNQNRNSKSFTRAKISPFLVALIVDQYLNDNNLPQTQFIFRHEASSLFADSLIDKELKSLLKLEMMLDEYMSLKQYKGMLDQQMIEVMQEKHRIRLLLQSLQNSIHLYNIPSSASPNDTIMKNNSAVVSQPRLCTNTPSGVSTATQSQPVSLRNNVETQNFSSPMISLSGKKRKDTQTINVPAVTKRPRGRPPGRKLPIQGQNTMPPSSAIVVNNQVASQSSLSTTQSPDGNCAPDRLQVEGKQMVSVQSSICISHVDIDSDMENKRKRLDASDMQKILDEKSCPNEASTSESGKKVAMPEIDFSDLDMDKLSDEFILHDFSDLPTLTHWKDNASGSYSHESNANQITSKLPQGVNTCRITEKGKNIQDC